VEGLLTSWCSARRSRPRRWIRDFTLAWGDDTRHDSLVDVMT
jgi:hypothetical protein